MEKKYWLVAIIILVILMGVLTPDLYKLLHHKRGYMITNFLPFGSKIYYQFPKPFNNGWELKEVSEADRSSFQIMNTIYARDKNHFFYHGKRREGVDKSSFQALTDVYGKDKNTVYYSNHDNKSPFAEASLEAIPGADPSTFQEFENAYATDKNFVYTYGKVLPSADVATFKVLQYGYAKDQAAVYYYGGKIAEADPESFQILDKGPNRYYAQDKKGIYNFGKLLKVDAATFDYPVVHFLPPSQS